ncbi:unnamed protein product [Cylindrotheca closterium]|uniref:Uncharacterized protein n=1 Tax=Cylindrotheca closterium TaxID=2856 RepID=A0AAD2CS82_9STRA|nr:unnamed protein product [Cylindrotheca closterium]
MDFPPLPPIPPASEISRYSSSSPPDFLTPITRYEADERARDVVYEIYEETPIDERVYHLTRALQIFPFSVDAFANWGYIYLHMVTPKKPQEAKEAYEKAVTCAKLLWPEFEHQDTIEWGHIEHRPYLRAVAGLAHAQQELGDLDEAIKGFRYLLKVNPSDNQGIRQDMFFAFLESGDYTLAEHFFHTQKNAGADLCWGNVLIVFRKFRREVVEEKEVQKGRVVVKTSTTILDLTTNVSMIPGRGLPDFFLAPGMKTHDPNNIVAFDNRISYDNRDASWRDKYICVRYDDVESIPFWWLLKCFRADLDDDKENHCSVCYEAARHRHVAIQLGPISVRTVHSYFEGCSYLFGTCLDPSHFKRKDGTLSWREPTICFSKVAA